MSKFNVWSPLADLDSVFALRSDTDPSANPTKLYYPQGNDLCLRYKVWTGGAQAAKTRYNVIQPNGTFKDLNEIFAPRGVTWIAMGTGTRSNVNAISAINNSNVYVGGYFTSPASYIAKWNGSDWEQLITLNSRVNAIHAKDNSNIYIGGEFTSPAGRIAKWVGNGLQQLGTGANNEVFSIYAVDNSNVYVGGKFLNLGDLNGDYIAKWNGSNWNSMVGGMNYTITPSLTIVRAISAVDNSNVYVGGLFNQVGGVNANNIAKWNGVGWSVLGTGTNERVFGIFALNNSNVYVVGNFTSAGGNSDAKYVAKWNGISWSALGTGLDTNANTVFAKDNSNVYVGGYFTSASGVGASYIAKWDGVTWQKFGGGAGFGVETIYAVDNSNVYVGGSFTNIGGDTFKSRIAKWSN
jgi:hypothetical protein